METRACFVLAFIFIISALNIRRNDLLFFFAETFRSFVPYLLLKLAVTVFATLYFRTL